MTQVSSYDAEDYSVSEFKKLVQDLKPREIIAEADTMETETQRMNHTDAALKNVLERETARLESIMSEMTISHGLHSRGAYRELSSEVDVRGRLADTIRTMSEVGVVN
ncbi:uncharacterized protein I303_102353 [Kwoniella dejecticola CBS 10117]|uniref:Uncharacterized protein n=1 Tax=Kwoniella dejecticola CBS 10117 TaxID=1296121 RepID=A0AAJ8MDX3_9TREE